MGLPLLKTPVPSYCQKETPPPRAAPKIAPAATSVVNGTCRRSLQAAPMLTGGWNPMAAATGRSWRECLRVVPSQRAWNANGVHSGITQKRRQEARSSHSCDPWLRPSLLSAVHAHAAQARGSALQAPSAPDPARETGTLTAALRLNQPGPWEEQGSFLCRQGSLPTHPHCTPANTTDARKLSQPLEKLNAF